MQFELQDAVRVRQQVITLEMNTFVVVYVRNHYFGLGPIPIPKPKLADTFGPIL